MPLQATSGAASYDAFGGGVAVVPAYIEDVFSTTLFTGNNSVRSITNDIDLAGKGGMVWIKSRSASGDSGTFPSDLSGKVLWTNYTNGTYAYGSGNDLTSFNSNGFSLGTNTIGTNVNAVTYASWTFRKQPKFFDVQTWTGSGANRTISHSLGSVPACIIVKRTDTTADWAVYHRSLANTQYLVLNTTAAAATGATRWNSTTPTSSVFSLGTDATVNASSGTYVAYIFAHDAGGFGLLGTDNVISCGSFTTDGSGNASVNLGYEPQFWLYKPNLAARYWTIYDVMRGWSQTEIRNLNPNVTDAEGGGAATAFYPTATGFDCVGGNLDASTQHIYIAIRRGPMKVPTLGTSVFNSLLITGNGANRTVTGVGFPADLFHSKARNIGFANSFYDRLRGATKELVPNSTAIENTDATSLTGFDVQDGVRLGTDSVGNATVNYPGGYDYVEHYFRRAPSFFDEVCYTGDGTTPQNITHNLSVAPEMMIIKCRSNASTSWVCYHKGVNGGVNPQNYYMLLQSDQAQTALSTIFNDTAPTSSVFTVGAQGSVGLSGRTHVAYLFATCAGVSKVGSYTGTATTKQIDCGFTAGARFVLIKRTDSTGDWYVWDTARGIVSGNDPYLLLNSTAAEVTNTDYIDTYSAGFEISSTAPAAINANGGTYIFLAIA
jgi:hypothetical protein